MYNVTCRINISINAGGLGTARTEEKVPRSPNTRKYRRFHITPTAVYLDGVWRDLAEDLYENHSILRLSLPRVSADASISKVRARVRTSAHDSPWRFTPWIV